MKEALGLLCILALAYLVQLAAHPAMIDGSAQPARAVMLVGLLMLGSWISGKLAEKAQIPAITGYLVLGVIVGPEVLGLIDEGMILRTEESGVPPLQFVSDLAIALIALTAGGEIRIPFLKKHFRSVSVILAVHMTVLMVAVAASIWFARNWIPFLAGADNTTILVIATLCAVVMVAKSPSVTIAMINDYDAKGPLSQTALVLIVLMDLLLIAMFSAVMAVSEGVLGQATISWGFIWAVGLQLIGSLLIGAILGWLMGSYVTHVKAHLPIFLAGSCLFIAVVGEHPFHIPGVDQHPVHFEPLLMALAAGLLLKNRWPEQSRPLFHAVEVTSLPVYCLFFAIAAAEIDLGAFANLWYLSLGIAVARLASTWAGIAWGTRLAGEQSAWAKHLWLGMISQAGVSLVLITVAAEAFSDFAWAEPLEEMVIGAIFINQLFGPILFRHALLKSGEGTAPTR